MPNKTERLAALDRVLSLLERVPLIDGHNDLALTIRCDPVAQGDVSAFGLRRRHQAGDTDLLRLREGRVSGQVWAAYVPVDQPTPGTKTLEQIDLLLRMNEAYAEHFMPVLHSSDFLRAKSAGKIGSMIAVEGGIGLENSIAPLRSWYALGVRLMTLCHNSSLDWVDSATDEARTGGLSEFGAAVIAEMNRLGIVVDCSHAADATIERVLEISEAPILCSHSNSRSLCQSPRNLSDDLLRRIRAEDGMVMATFVPQFVSEDLRRWITPLRASVGRTLPRDWAQRLKNHETVAGPAPCATLAQVADHIEYMTSILGWDHIGLGSDYHSGANRTLGLEDVSCYPHLLAELAYRGWSDEKLAGLAGGNLISLMQRVEVVAEKHRRDMVPPRLEATV